MSAGELIDTFDDRGRLLGPLDRAEAHRQGLWHQVAHVLIIAGRPEGPAAILQRRSLSKRTFPGLVDLSATGHLAAGEHPRQCVREVQEELGADVAPAELFPLGVRRLVDATPEGINRELVHVFLVRRDDPLSTYRPDPTELESVIEVPIQALLTALDPDREPVFLAPAEEMMADGELHAVTLGAGDLVPEPALLDVSGTHPRAYWVSVLSVALAYMEGRRPLAI